MNAKLFLPLLIIPIFIFNGCMGKSLKEDKSMGTDNEQALRGKKVAMIVAYRDFRDEEYFVPKQILERAGAEIFTASTQKGIAKGIDGGEVNVEVLLKDLFVARYDAIVFIGGPGAVDLINNADCNRIANEAMVKKKILGAICIAPLILAKAGAISSMKATVWSSTLDRAPIKELEENGAFYQDQPVVIDRNLITANGPKAADEFGQALVKALTNANNEK